MSSGPIVAKKVVKASSAVSSIAGSAPKPSRFLPERADSGKRREMARGRGLNYCGDGTIRAHRTVTGLV